MRLISAADKVHNARSILADLRTHGVVIFDRFKGGRDGTLWYYRALANTFKTTGPAALADELERVVDEIGRLTTAATSSTS